MGDLLDLGVDPEEELVKWLLLPHAQPAIADRATHLAFESPCVPDLPPPVAAASSSAMSSAA
eukprot:12377886-Alexandrium_andersonii.AAC.1